MNWCSFVGDLLGGGVASVDLNLQLVSGGGLEWCGLCKICIPLLLSLALDG